MNIIETNLNFGALSTRKSTSRIIIHNAAAITCSAEDIHRWHKARGWAGAGYHFLVRKDGNVYRLRPENTIGAHASGSNSNSLGICFEGNYDTETTMPSAQMKSGKELVAYLKNKWGINTVQAHRDVCPTSCPGNNFPFNEIAGASGSVTVNTSSSSSTSTSSSRNYLQTGDKSSAVKELQNLLIAHGYSCGSYGADGIFGQSTKNAVLNFQRDNGLVADALAGVKTMAKLRQSGSSNSASSSSSNNWVARLQKECNAQGFSNQTVDGIAGQNTLNGCPTMRKGARGNITKLLQERLNALGYNCGNADGIFGQNTENAITKFQSAKGLSVDGIVGKNTWRKLLGL